MSKDNHIKEKAKAIKEADLPLFYALEQFLQKLDKKPQDVAKATQQGSYEYLPISYVTALLNQTFLGRVQTKNFTIQPMHLQLVGTIELHVFHPITKEWIVKTGAAATQIRCPRNSDKPIKGGLSMDVPRLLADCIKNAAKQFGKVFGADLNRKEEASYHAGIASYVNKQSYDKDQILLEIKHFSSVSELATYWETLTIAQQDPEIQAAYATQVRDINDTTFA